MQNLYERQNHHQFPNSNASSYIVAKHSLLFSQKYKLSHTLRRSIYEMSSSKKKYILSAVAVNLGCGSSCRRPKLSAVFNPRPRNHHNHSGGRKPIGSSQYRQYSSSSSWETTTTTFSSAVETPGASDTDSDVRSLKAVQGFGRIGGSSVAVEKDSDDPYLDFRRSMLQMILEKEIYAKDDLKELLNCFLQLNSPYYHGIIVRAFTEIWNGVYSSGNWMSRDF